jgi:hypothetical protein
MPYYTYYTLFFVLYALLHLLKTYSYVFIWGFDTFWHNPTYLCPIGCPWVRTCPHMGPRSAALVRSSSALSRKMKNRGHIPINLHNYRNMFQFGCTWRRPYPHMCPRSAAWVRSSSAPSTSPTALRAWPRKFVLFKYTIIETCVWPIWVHLKTPLPPHGPQVGCLSKVL